MKSSLSSLAIVVLLVALGLLTVVALPRGMEPATASAPAAPAAAPLLEVAAPNAAKYNMIAMPLNASQQFSSAGYSFDADGLAALVGPSVQQVLRWNASTQTFEARIPGVDGPNFALAVGGVYWLLLDSAAPTVLSFVGDVPAAGSISYSLVGGSPCKYNAIMLPLDQASITTADQLAAAIGNVAQVLSWNASTQTYQTRLPGIDGPNFAVKIGYPYLVCMDQSKTWP